jgi:hypothetical protein
MRTRLLVLLTLLSSLVLVPAVPAFADLSPTGCAPYVTLTPPFGMPGTVVSVNVNNFHPDTDFTVRLRVAGDPVLGTGHTDEHGHANFVFTMPNFDGDWVNVYVKGAPCNEAGARFTRKVLQTPTFSTPTAVPTTPPPTVVPPTGTPPVLPLTPTPSPVRPTPVVPFTGSGTAGPGGFGSLGTNLVLLAVVLMVGASGFAVWGAGQRRKALPIRKDE